MARQVSAAHEFRERGLRKLVGVQVGGLLHQAQPLDRVFRADAPADAQPGKCNFRKAVDLDHVAVAVERFQRRDGRAAQA